MPTRLPHRQPSPVVDLLSLVLIGALLCAAIYLTW